MAAGRAGEQRTRGLPSLEEAKAERRRAIVFGKVRLRALPPQFWLLAATTIGAICVIYWRIAQGALEGQKSAVMAKQRAVASSLGPKILPFSGKIEGWVKELAANFPGDLVAPGVSLSKVQSSPGVYLRLRIDNARETKHIRKAAVRSLHDGFTSCFFVRAGAADPTKGPSCNSPADCEPGKLCNEWKVCTVPPEPYNMRLVYRALKVLSTEWTDELHETTNDLTVTAYDRDLDAVTKNDVPIAIDMLSRARYFTLVLDEDPAGGLQVQVDGGASETEEERVQREPHTARVGIWDLKNDQPLLRLRTKAEGHFVPVGEHVIGSAESLAAQQRQANSCAIALEAKKALGDSGAQ